MGGAVGGGGCNRLDRDSRLLEYNKSRAIMKYATLTSFIADPVSLKWVIRDGAGKVSIVLTC